eukprot:COSAG02_NODE_1336_length_13186_cov_3.900657_6_plen_164_part_00
MGREGGGKIDKFRHVNSLIAGSEAQSRKRIEPNPNSKMKVADTGWSGGTLENFESISGPESGRTTETSGQRLVHLGWSPFARQLGATSLRAVSAGLAGDAAASEGEAERRQHGGWAGARRAAADMGIGEHLQPEYCTHSVHPIRRLLEPSDDGRRDHLREHGR